MVPGVIFGWAAGARRITLITLAPAFSATIAGVAAFVAPFLGLRWNVWTVLGAAAVLAVVALVVRRLVGRSAPEPGPVPFRRPLEAATALALLAAAGLIAYRMIWAFENPENISQTYDNVFHLNAIRWALDSGNASPLNLGLFTGISAYPSGWHGLVSLLVEITGASIPVGVNVANVVIGALVWPLGCVYFAQMLMGRRIVPTIIAAVLSAGFSAFPLLMVDWGVLYPNLLSISLLPAALATFVAATGFGKVADFSKPIQWLVALTVIPGVALAHPSTMMALFVFMLPALLILFWHTRKGLLAQGTPAGRRNAMWLSVLTGAGVLAFGLAWYVVRPPESAAGWLAFQSSAQAMGEILLSAPMGRPAAGVMGILLVTGIIVMLRRRDRLWLLLMFAVGAFLYFYASGMVGRPRGLITGIWYYDSYRLAALMPVVTLGPAVVGGTWLYDRAITAARGWSSTRMVAGSYPRLQRLRDRGLARPLALLGATLVLIAGTQYASVGFAAYQTSLRYDLNDDSLLVSSDELALMKRLPSEVPADAVIAVMPSNGSALAYALAGRKVLQPHILTTHGYDTDVINRSLKFAASLRSVCESVRTENVRYILDFGTKAVTGFMPGYTGVRNVGESPEMTLVDSEGKDAKLYRVDACW
ncbi:MAG: hypothetical protein JWQ75_129 [Pseudarthrobacter sp.]|nr:hypothetical protein [Pseudarthrobacter sp.]